MRDLLPANTQGTAARSSWCSPRQTRRGTCCAHVDKPPDRPDLAIYSQLEQYSLGLAPTWNSPDITTNSEIPWTLMPEAFVVVRNLSASASAINGLVTLSTSPFGIGTPRTQLGAKTISLAPSASISLNFPLTPALLAGEQSLGFHVDISHPYDAKPINNRGSQTLKATTTSASGRNISFSFPVANTAAAPRTIDLAVLASPFVSTVTPLSHAFAPFEQITATLNVTVPAATHGTTASPGYNEITVVGSSGGQLVDGATHIVFVDD